MSGHARALLAEAAGTFWFFTIGAGSIIALVVAGSPAVGLLAIALAHGLALSVAISTFGAISGGHFNPAVTFGLAIANKHPWGRVPTYWAAQLIGAVAAGLVLRYFFDSSLAAASQTHLGTPTLGTGVTVLTAIVIEAVLTLFLVWAVFGTAVSPTAPKIGGFGIGLTVAADILLGGPLTGAAMNPARHFGPAVVAGFFDNWYVYWIGPLVGAALAGLSVRYLFPGTIEPIATPAPRTSDRTERI
jgi:aquaporin Z